MLKQGAHSTPHRKVDRVSLDRAAAYEILDEALICHVGFIADGSPVVIPTIHWRIGDRLYFHGSHGSRMGQTMAAGHAICVTATLLDGLVLARSAFHHSMNFRSVVLFGKAWEIDDPSDKAIAFDALMAKMTPDRCTAIRPANARELATTKLVALTIDEGSVKVRRGPPIDSAEDIAWPVWAGVVPLALTPGTPVADKA
jgi:hypothetical protein